MPTEFFLIVGSSGIVKRIPHLMPFSNQSSDDDAKGAADRFGRAIRPLGEAHGTSSRTLIESWIAVTRATG